MSNNILDDSSTFSNPLKQELYKHINKEERLLWTERPKQGLLFRSSDSYMIPFSLFWGGFAFFWEFMVLNMGAPIFMALFGIPFVLVGLYFIVGRFFHDMYLRKNTIYGLTNKQVIIKRGDKLQFVDISALTDIQLTKNKNGSGSILFRNKYTSFDNQSIQNNLRLINPKLSFEEIPNVQSVYNQIEKLRHL